MHRNVPVYAKRIITGITRIKLFLRNDLDGRSSMKLKGDSLERNRSHIVQTANRRSSTSGKIIVQIHNARCM